MMRRVGLLALALLMGFHDFGRAQGMLARPAPEALPRPAALESIKDALPPPPKIWTGSAELGLNGAEGNSQNMKGRFATGAKRQTLDSILKFDILVSVAAQNGEVSENRSMSNLGYEWLFRDSPWSHFVTGQVETDEFKEFDVRISGHTGLGYAFLKRDTTLVKGRFGAGGSREFGGASNDFKPELDFGLDVEYKVTGRHKFVATLDYFPNVLDFTDYRVQAKAAYEILIDPEWNVTLKLGLLERYDSTPQGKRPNDFDYFAVLLWKF